jgi:hypothetical protein
MRNCPQLPRTRIRLALNSHSKSLPRSIPFGSAHSKPFVELHRSRQRTAVVKVLVPLDYRSVSPFKASWLSLVIGIPSQVSAFSSHVVAQCHSSFLASPGHGLDYSKNIS